MMKMRFPFFLLLVFICLSVSAQHLTRKNYQRKISQNMGLIYLSDSVYYDRNAITNLDWMEYQYWLERIYGKESPEFNASLPDTEIIRQQMSFVEPIVYLRSPAYLKLPVLGVSSEQARAYCRWRTDRLAESILVNMKLLEWDSQQTPENYFSIEKYENPDSLRFLIFSLPSETAETLYGFRCVGQWR